VATAANISKVRNRPQPLAAAVGINNVHKHTEPLAAAAESGTSKATNNRPDCDLRMMLVALLVITLSSPGRRLTQEMGTTGDASSAAD
jgi:hypothetical protein